MEIDFSELDDFDLRMSYIYIRIGFDYFEELAGGETPMIFFTAFEHVYWGIQTELLERGIDFGKIDREVIRYMDSDDDFGFEELTGDEIQRIDPEEAERLKEEYDTDEWNAFFDSLDSE
jgi:hypothetical protein